jgi:hypothetical protein
MSAENVEVVRRFLEAYEKGGIGSRSYLRAHDVKKPLC